MISRTAVLPALILALCAVDLVSARVNPRIRRRDTLRQIHPRRKATPYIDENARHPVNYRPSVYHGWMFNGNIRTSTWPQMTGKNFYTLSGRRSRSNRAGQWRINNNRSTLIRRRSFRDRE